MTAKYDYALSQFPGKIIVVRCDTCDVDCDVREVTNEVQHPHALHVMSFDCPKGHLKLRKPVEIIENRPLIERLVCIGMTDSACIEGKLPRL